MIPSRFRVLIQCALVGLALAASQTVSASSPAAADMVMSGGDVLDLILAKVPLRHLRAFNRASRDYIRPRRLFDPFLPLRHLPAAIMALNHTAHRDVLRVVLADDDEHGARSWFLAWRLVELRMKRRLPADQTIVLARHLVESLGLGGVGALLPACMIGGLYDAKVALEFLRLGASNNDIAEICASLPDFIVSCIDAAVNDAMRKEFQSHCFSSGVRVHDVDHATRNRLLLEFRRNPQLMTDTSMQMEILNAIHHQIEDQHPDAIGDVRRLMRHFISDDRKLKFEGESGALFPLLSACFPEPFNYIFVNPDHVRHYLYKALPLATLTDPDILSRLRRVGLIFPMLGYIHYLDLPCGVLARVVPFLDHSAAYDALNRLFTQRKFGDMLHLRQVPSFVANLNRDRSEFARRLRHIIYYESTEAFRVMMEVAAVTACLSVRYDDENNLLHVAVLSGDAEKAEIILSHRPEFANERNRHLKVPLQLVRKDRDPECYDKIEAFTHSELL